MTARAARRMLGESREELSYDDVGAPLALGRAAAGGRRSARSPPSSLLPRAAATVAEWRSLDFLDGASAFRAAPAACRSRARSANRTSPAARRRRPAEIVPKRVAAGTIAARMAEAPADPGQPSRA